MSINGQEDQVSGIYSSTATVSTPSRQKAISTAAETPGNELSRLSLELECCKTKLTQANAALRQYAELFNHAPIGYLIVDRLFHIVKINRTASKLLELCEDAGPTTLFPLCTSTEDNEQIKNLTQIAINGSCTRVSVDIELGRCSKTPVTLFLQSTNADALNRNCCLIAIININSRSVVDKQAAGGRDYLQHLATHDELTQLPNRRLFYRSLATSIKSAQRDEHSLGIAVLDLDQFKVINDTFGHDIGDELLVKTAQRLKDTLGPENIVARLAGDEFVLIIKNIHHRSELEAICESVRLALSLPYQLNTASEIQVDASIGVSVYPTDACLAKELIKCADTAMYQAKSSGGSCVHYFTRHMARAQRRKCRLQKEIHTGIENKDFEAWFQPIYHCSSNSFASVEVLARWRHPERGLLLPGDFIKLAEDCGAIESLGCQILTNAFRQQHELMRAGLAHIVVSVNISPRQIITQGFVEKVEEILCEQKADPSRIRFELTENSLLDAGAGISTAISKLHSLGIRFTIDNLGTGYSSFSQIANLPVSNIKIDQTLTQDIPHTKENIAIVKATISMAKNLQILVSSKGVESQEQFNFLRTAGCDEIQGFLLSMPMPAKELSTFLNTDCADTQLSKIHAFNAQPDLNRAAIV